MLCCVVLCCVVLCCVVLCCVVLCCVVLCCVVLCCVVLSNRASIKIKYQSKETFRFNHYRVTLSQPIRVGVRLN